ncbi:kinase-like protein [Venturia nashicola]|nr:kinase-like protein [Venturia nashicola]
MADSSSSTATTPDAIAVTAAGRTSPTPTPASDDSTPKDEDAKRDEDVTVGNVTGEDVKKHHGEISSPSTPSLEKQTTPETRHATAPSVSPTTPGLRTELHKPLRPEHDADYFLLSPKPKRYLTIPQGAVPEPSPRSQSTPYTLTSSKYTENSPPLLREQALAHTEASGRPTVFRDLSNSSILSTTSTVRGADLTSSLSQVRSRDFPSFPNQAFSALQSQHHPVRAHPQYLRARTSIHSIHTSYSEANSPGPEPVSRQYPTTNSPSLYTPNSSPYRPGQTQAELAGTYSTPYLHPSHHQVPKETHLAEKDVDPISGRRLINQYEIIDELGRGVHGKVKLGRNLETGQFVAIKIVQRYSKRKRLGKNNSHESKIKQEIAILKKARHPNIVGLLEVIDDPSLQKVYIVLEHVQMGEVQWRKEGAEEVCLLEWRRCKREMDGIFDNDAAKREDDRIYHDAMQHYERKQRRNWRRLQKARGEGQATDSWSLELGDDEDDFDDASRASASTSSMSYVHSEALAHHDLAPGGAIADSTSLHQQASDVDVTNAPSSAELSGDRLYNDSLQGTMHGAYEPVLGRGRTPSMTDTSSESGWEQELRNQVPENYHYVPLMTLEQARQAFRDTVLGLDYLHYQGVIHRDIKPANLLQAADHHIKISDFGVSYLGRERTERTDDEYSESDAPDIDEAVELAKTVGTPAFYAPELCSTDLDPEETPPPVTGAIDVWALGVTLYCLVYGRVPFYEDNTFVLMRTVAEHDVYIPSLRLKAVELHSNSRPSSHGRMWQPTSSNKRLPHELEYEDVNDELKDLLKRMLTKDPQKRISLFEVKHHSWVVHDIPNKIQWLEDTDPSKMSSGQKVEVSKEDVDVAVVPISHFLDKVKSFARRAGQAVGLTGTKTSTRTLSRRRAKSTATSASGDHSQPTSAASSSSTISQDARQEKRRPSMIPGDIIQALKASAAARDSGGEHPLSQSVTASPEVKEFPEFFADEESQPDSPMSTISQGCLRMKSTKRPSLDRTQTTISKNGSIRTIRPSDMNTTAGGATTLPALPSTPLESHPSSNLQGIFSGTKHKLMKIGRSRSRSTSKFGRASPVDRVMGDDDDAHAQPSLGLSDTTALGQVNSSSTLFEGSTAGSSAAASPESSRAPSISSRSAADFLRPDFVSSHEGNLSRNSSVSSRSSRQRYRSMSRPSVSTSTSTPSYLPLLGESSEERFSKPNPQALGDSSEHSQRRAKEEQIRRLMLEVGTQERPISAMGRERAESSVSQECPPSPDDFAYRQNSYSPDPTHMLTGYPSQSSQLVSSSSDDHFTGMSQSTSNPSIPSVLSADSSVQADDNHYLSNQCEQSYHSQHHAMSSGEKTMNDDSHEDYSYDGDAAVESDGSDDSFIEMIPKKKTRSESVTIGEVANSHLSIKSERSDSNNTMKKIKSREEDEDRDQSKPLSASQ